MSEKQIERSIAVLNVHIQDLPLHLRDEAKNRLYYRLGRMWQQFGDKKNAIRFYRQALKCSNRKYVMKAVLFLTILIFTPANIWRKI